MKTQDPAAEIAVPVLSLFQPADTAVLDIRQSGTGKPTGWKLTMAGPGHEKTIAYANEASRDALRRQAVIEAQQLNGRKIKPEERDVIEQRRENVRGVVARILDWTPVRLKPDGEVISFSEKAAIDLLADPENGWIYVQILEFISEEKSFIKASATS